MIFEVSEKKSRNIRRGQGTAIVTVAIRFWYSVLVQLCMVCFVLLKSSKSICLDV